MPRQFNNRGRRVGTLQIKGRTLPLTVAKKGVVPARACAHQFDFGTVGLGPGVIIRRPLTPASYHHPPDACPSRREDIAQDRSRGRSDRVYRRV
jgi:hypothetical protein